MEYITIAEFAEKAGVTPQAIYKRLKTDLEPYFKVENGVKLIEIAALELYNPTKQSKREKELLDRVEELEKLNDQLNKDKLSLLERLTENNEKLLEMLSNYQVLLAQQQHIQQSLLQLPQTVENQINQLKEVKDNENKRGLFGLFSKRNKV